MTTSYSDADAAIRREFYAQEAGGAAATTYSKFRAFRRSKLKNVYAIVTTAGTVVGHKFDVLNGTTSVGSIAVGTAAVGSVVTAVPQSVGGLDLIIDGPNQMSVKSGADTVGKADIVYEYQVLHDGTTTK